MGLTQKLGTIPLAIQTDSSNNVGIGGAANASYKLDVTGTIRATGSIFGDVGFRTKSLNGYLLKNDADSANLGGLVRRSYWAGGAALDTQIFAETGYGIFLNVNGSSSTGMVINSSGNVGIGTSSPANLLSVVQSNSAASTTLDITNSSNASTTTKTAQLLFRISDTANDNKPAAAITAYPDGVNNISGGMYFSTRSGDGGPFERMRITSGGTLAINATGTIGNVNEKLTVVSIEDASYFRTTNTFTGGTSIACNRTSSGGNFLYFTYSTSNSPVGSISTNGSSTSFNTTSDYRLKEDLKEIDGLGIIKDIKVYDFKWINSEIRESGVLAHEIEEILPYIVNGKKDEINEDGNIKPQGVDYSKIVPILISAIQELSAKVTALENK